MNQTDLTKWSVWFMEPDRPYKVVGLVHGVNSICEPTWRQHLWG